jgi:hypothetical protein
MGNKQPLQQMVLGKVVICLQKTETISMFITLYMFITSTKEIYELINVYHFKLLSFSQLKMDQKTLISAQNSEDSTGGSRKHSGSNRYRKGLPQ